MPPKNEDYKVKVYEQTGPNGGKVITKVGPKYTTVSEVGDTEGITTGTRPAVTNMRGQNDKVGLTPADRVDEDKFRKFLEAFGRAIGRK